MVEAKNNNNFKLDQSHFLSLSLSVYRAEKKSVVIERESVFHTFCVIIKSENLILKNVCTQFKKKET